MIQLTTRNRVERIKTDRLQRASERFTPVIFELNGNSSCARNAKDSPPTTNLSAWGVLLAERPEPAVQHPAQHGAYAAQGG